MTVSKDSEVGRQILDSINNLKLEFAKLEYNQGSIQNIKSQDLEKLKESIAAKRLMIEKIDAKISEWKETLDILIPRLNTFKARSFRSDQKNEYKIKDVNDILPYLSSIENALIDSNH